jgi:outer membrane protein assembly factor BamB
VGTTVVKRGRLVNVLPLVVLSGVTLGYFGAIDPAPPPPTAAARAGADATLLEVPDVYQARGGAGRHGVESLTALLEVPDSRARLAMGRNLGPAVARDHFAYMGIHEHIRALDLAQDITAWTAGLQGQVSASPVIVGELVVAMTDDALHGLDIDNGERKWELPIGPGTYTPLAIGRIAFLGGRDGVVRAVDTGPGVELWSLPLNGALAGPMASDGQTVVAVTGEGSIHAFGLDGIPQWTQTIDGSPDDGPVVADDVVYVAGGTQLYAFGLSSGETLWATEIGSRVIAAPAVANGLVFLSTDQGEVVAVNVALGRESWRHRVFDLIAGSPMVFGESIVVLGAEGRIASLAATDGGCERSLRGACKVHWSLSIPGNPARNSALIRVGDSFVLNTPPFILVFGA